MSLNIVINFPESCIIITQFSICVFLNLTLVSVITVAWTLMRSYEVTLQLMLDIQKTKQRLIHNTYRCIAICILYLQIYTSMPHDLRIGDIWGNIGNLDAKIGC